MVLPSAPACHRVATWLSDHACSILVSPSKASSHLAKNLLKQHCQLTACVLGSNGARQGQGTRALPCARRAPDEPLRNVSWLSHHG